MARSNRPKGAPANPSRSVRVDDTTWNKAVSRANYEGVTMSEVLLRFVQGYAAGLLNLPRVQVVYSTSAGSVPAPSPPSEAS